MSTHAGPDLVMAKAGYRRSLVELPGQGGGGGAALSPTGGASPGNMGNAHDSILPYPGFPTQGIKRGPRTSGWLGGPPAQR